MADVLHLSSVYIAEQDLVGVWVVTRVFVAWFDIARTEGGLVIGALFDPANPHEPRVLYCQGQVRMKEFETPPSGLGSVGNREGGVVKWMLLRGRGGESAGEDVAGIGARLTGPVHSSRTSLVVETLFIRAPFRGHKLWRALIQEFVHGNPDVRQYSLGQGMQDMESMWSIWTTLGFRVGGSYVMVSGADLLHAVHAVYPFSALDLCPSPGSPVSDAFSPASTQVWP